MHDKYRVGKQAVAIDVVFHHYAEITFNYFVNGKMGLTIRKVVPWELLAVRCSKRHL